MGGNMVSMGLSMLVLYATVALTLPYLGGERFGAWMTIASLVGVLSFADFGVGNALLTRSAYANAQSPGQLAKVFLHGMLALTGIGIAIYVLISALLRPELVATLIKVDSSAVSREVFSAIQLFFIIFCLSIPCSGIAKTLMGLQCGGQVHVARGAASLASLILLYFAAQDHAEMPVLLLVTYGLQSIAPLFLIPVLIKKGALSFAALQQFRIEPDLCGRLLKSGGGFLFLQVGTMLATGIDALLVSATLGAAEVARLAIVQRLYQWVCAPMAVLTGPLWGAYADASAHGDKAFVRRTLARSLCLVLGLSAAGSCLIFAMSSWVIDVWIKGAVTLPYGLVFAMAVWVIMDSVGAAFAAFLNGVNEIRAQILSVSILCLLAVPIKLFLLDRLGVTGVIWGTIIAYTIATIVFYGVVFKRLLLSHVA
jgi:O-antigen/teichoic acid export membrane protein